MTQDLQTKQRSAGSGIQRTGVGSMARLKMLQLLSRDAAQKHKKRNGGRPRINISSKRGNTWPREIFNKGGFHCSRHNRSNVLNSKAPEGLQLAAIELRREAEKVSGWRAKAIADLICDEKGELRKDIFTRPARMRVINALALRDDQFQTNYLKILLRRRHLFRLFLLLLTGIAASLLLSYFDILPPPFNKVELMAGVVLFGVLGAALSVARGLLRADVSAKIPAQQIGSFVIWMRPAIGAAAALISFVFLNAKAIRVFDWDPTESDHYFHGRDRVGI